MNESRRDVSNFFTKRVCSDMSFQTIDYNSNECTFLLLFQVSENLLSIYLDEYEETPWDALKYLVSSSSW